MATKPLPKIEYPVTMTVAFECRTSEAFDELWRTLRGPLNFMAGDDVPMRAYAVSRGDMFAEQDAIEAALESDLTGDELKECIGDLICCQDVKAVLEKWEITTESEA